MLGLDMLQDDLQKTRFALYTADNDKKNGNGNGWLAVRGDAMSLPLKSGSFDRVICSEVLEHVADDKRSVGELVRVLKDDGVIAVSVPTRLTESIYWRISRQYSRNPGGHTCVALLTAAARVSSALVAPSPRVPARLRTVSAIRRALEAACSGPTCSAWAAPPGRVGRLAAIEGEVSVFADAELGWERAGLNAHLTSENSVWTEPRARAEVRVGSVALRLEEATQLDIVRLDDDALLGHVMRGSLAVGVRYFERDESLVLTTPSARFQIRGNGRYRIDVDADTGESLLTVFSGSARLEVSGGSVIVAPAARCAWPAAPGPATHSRTRAMRRSTSGQGPAMPSTPKARRPVTSLRA